MRCCAEASAAQLARVALKHEVVLTHGNGPQVGLLALQAAAYTAVQGYPLDVLGAQTDGMIGYLLEQELSNRLPPDKVVVTLLTRVEVNLDDPAFAKPSKPIGPVYSRDEADRVAAEKHWVMEADGAGFRRVVASPQPQRVLGLGPIRWLLDHQALVIAAGGGGIPVAVGDDGRSRQGVEAVIDKDLCSGLLARELNADCLVIATDVLSRLETAGAASLATGVAGRVGASPIPRRFDGAQGRSGVPFRGSDWQTSADRLARTH